MIVAFAVAQLALAAATPVRGGAAAPAAEGKGGKAPPSASTAAKPAPPTHVQADTADYDYKRRRTVMLGDPLVTLTREDATLVCRKLVTEDDETGHIKRATCDGDVKLTRGEREVTCAHAVYEAGDGKITCVGDPVLKDGASVIRCEQLVYVLDDDKVFLKKPKGTLVQKPGQELRKGKAP